MDWIEITVSVKSSDLEEAEAIANMTVDYGIYIEDYSTLEEEVMDIAHIDLIDEDLLKKDRDTAKIHIFIDPEDNISEAAAFLSERLRNAGIDFEISTENVQEDDWLNNWRKYFKPQKIGEKLLINPSWFEVPKDNTRAVLNIDPGLAFGTGKHETTRLCLKMLEKYVKEGQTVLDIGCGSGILGIASVLLGAQKSVGVDIDEKAVKTASQNAKLNKVEDKFTALCGDLTDKINEKFDIIVANIVADVIINLSSGVDSFMTKDALFIISGIIDSRADEVRAKVSEKFKLIKEAQDGCWYCFVFKNK